MENTYQEINDNHLTSRVYENGDYFSMKKNINKIYENYFHINKDQSCPCKNAQKLIYLDINQINNVNQTKKKISLRKKIKNRIFILILNISNKINRKLLEYKKD